MPPLTNWNPTSGDGEYSATGNPNLDTENSKDIITESGLNIVLEDVSFTGVPTTTWAVDDSK